MPCNITCQNSLLRVKLAPSGAIISHFSYSVVALYWTMRSPRSNLRPGDIGNNLPAEVVGWQVLFMSISCGLGTANGDLHLPF